MPQLTYRQTSPDIFRVSVDGVEIGSILKRTRHVEPITTTWHWGVDIMPLMSHGGGVPSGDIEPPGVFEDALKAFRAAFLRWHATVPPDVWTENMEHKRASAERWK